MDSENLESVMTLIIHAGNAKSAAMEAIHLSKTGEFQEADEKIKEAFSEITLAHNGQTKLLTMEASGTPVEISLLLIHSQDHLMTALNFVEVAKEIIELHKKIAG